MRPGTPTHHFGAVVISPDERWFEIGPPGERRRVGFHDYARIYAEPGLYERVFIDELGMRSAFEVVRLFGAVLRRLDRDPAAECILDIGAGNGIGGEALRELGVGRVLALDLEPMARTAAARDRPGVYAEYVVGDLLADAARFAGEDLTAVLALSAIGAGHIPPAALARAVGLLGPGGIYAFAVMPALLPDSDDEAGRATGYPDYLGGLLAESEELAREAYVHRRQADGTPHDAVALVGQVC
jgi:SAM-dependent methyltransferase